MRQRDLQLSRLTYLGTVAIFLVAVGTVEIFHHLISINRQADARARVTNELINLRTRIEAHSNAAIYLVRGLAAYLQAYPDATREQIEPVIKNIYIDGKSIRSIAVAPDLVVRMVYPLKGNEKVLNVDFRKVPEQWPYVEKAVALKETVLDGPVTLIQGGRGLINRTPVFVKDGKLWGIISVVLDIDKLLAASQVTAEPANLHLYLYNPSKQNKGFIFGDPKVLEGPQYISLPLYLHNETWMLAATAQPPKGLWWLQLTRVIGWLASMVFAGMFFTIIREHSRNKILVNTDSLTGLPNRRAFYQKLNDNLGQYRKSGQPFGIVYLDLNGFKEINDNHGHETGDDVLVMVARRLQEVSRPSDQYYRLGGDEFVGVLDGIKDREQADAMAKRLLEAVNRDMHLDNSLVLRISTALGYSFPSPGDDIDTLLTRADKRMYQDKHRDSEPDHTI
ncbi:diguanylate cyclase domain-containing protein [Gallaecimonas pentaromativorans]|uniref:diguanylate cyclase domain-containing protein n=1 Tax=Gallaecimonas pentaromativorans TaxID=584787 RepID=UPI003A920181